MAPISLILEIESESETVSLSLDCETPSAVRAFVAGLGLFGPAKERLEPISYAGIRERFDCEKAERQRERRRNSDAACFAHFALRDAGLDEEEIGDALVDHVATAADRAATQAIRDYCDAKRSADAGDAITEAKRAASEGKRQPFYPRMERRGDVWVVVDATDPAFEPLLEWDYDGDTEVLVAASAMQDDGAAYQWRIASVLEGPPGFVSLADSDSELDPSKTAFERLAMAAWRADKLEAALRERCREEAEREAAAELLTKARPSVDPVGAILETVKAASPGGLVVLPDGFEVSPAPLDHAADEDLPASAADLQTLPGAELQAVEDAAAEIQEELAGQGVSNLRGL